MKPIFFLLLGLLTAPQPGQTQDTSGPPINRRIHAYLSEAKAASPAPGFSVVIVRGDEIVFSRGYGVRVAGSSPPMTAQTSTAVGSLTKSMTAIAVMQLVEQGRVVLDQPVITYLPEFRTANPERSDRISVRMLLNNTSGLPGGVSNRWRHGDAALDRLLETLQSVYLYQEPGRSYTYSNAGFSLAGLIVGRVSELPYEEYLEWNLFRPLEMERTSTNPADFEWLDVLYGHHPGLTSGIPSEATLDSPEMAAAGSLLRSSSEDIGHYLIALLNSGIYNGHQVVSPESIHEMWSPAIAFPGLSTDQGGDGQDFHYGLGWMISEVDGRTLVHHGGSTGTMGSMTILDPQASIAASMLINLDYTFIDRYQYDSAFHLLNNLLHLMEGEPLTDFGNPAVPDPTLNDYVLPTLEHSRYTGSFRFAGKGDIRNYQATILDIESRRGGVLEGRIRRGKRLIRRFELDFLNPSYAVTRDVAAPQSVQFNLRPDGHVSGLYFAGSAFHRITADWEVLYQLWVPSGMPVRFYGPAGWQLASTKDGFVAVDTLGAGLSMQGGFVKLPFNELEAVIGMHFQENRLVFSGPEIIDVRGQYYWEQQAFVSESEGRKWQHLVLVEGERTGGFYLLLTAPYGVLGSVLQAMGGTLVDTFSIEEAN